MIENLQRIFRTAYQGLKRNNWLSVACISMMTLSLILFSSMLLFNYLSTNLINVLKAKMDLSIYFKNDIPEEDILKIKDELLKNDLIASISYTSKDEALKIFTEQAKYNPALQQALNLVGENPLTPSLNIKAKNSKDYDKIVSMINNSGFKDKLLQIDLTQNQIVINRMNKISFAIKITSLIAVSLLVFLSFIISFNTIRMAIYSLREEIEIMKLVGANNWFIRGTFIIEGIIQSLIASLITFIILVIIFITFGGRLDSYLPELSISNYFLNHWLFFLGSQTLFGLVVGILASTFAINKYLNI
jgi:cell division transport system permease protein